MHFFAPSIRLSVSMEKPVRHYRRIYLGRNIWQGIVRHVPASEAPVKPQLASPVKGFGGVDHQKITGKSGNDYGKYFCGTNSVTFSEQGYKV